MAGPHEHRSHQFGGTQNKILATGVAVLLLLPMVAMHFTDAVDWTAFDFAAAALLLGGGAIGYDVATRKARSGRSRMIAAAAVILFIAIFWAQGAVGIF